MIPNPLLFLLLLIAAAGGGAWCGIDYGRTQAQARQDAQTVKQLAELIDANKTLAEQANKASRAMRSVTAKRAEADAKSTKEFQDALAATADSRAGCVFDDGVMRQLDAARERATQAAAGGLRAPVPGAAGGAGKGG